MQYFGGKQRISKPLAEFLNSKLKEGQTFVDLFCGSCNVVAKIDDNRLRIANDKHKYLIAMWKSLQEGWIPPDNITREEYKYIKNNKDELPHLTGFVGFGCSFAGRWFEGYAYNSKGFNYCMCSKKSCIKKLKNLNGVVFTNKNYNEVNIPSGSLVYCDISYKGTKPYCKSEVGVFNHDEFYQWVRDNSNTYDIYISEYKKNVPSDFEIVWEIESRKLIRNAKNEAVSTVEVLIKYTH